MFEALGARCSRCLGVLGVGLLGSSGAGLCGGILAYPAVLVCSTRLNVNDTNIYI